MKANFWSTLDRQQPPSKQRQILHSNNSNRIFLFLFLLGSLTTTTTIAFDLHQNKPSSTQVSLRSQSSSHQEQQEHSPKQQTLPLPPFRRITSLMKRRSQKKQQQQQLLDSQQDASAAGSASAADPKSLVVLQHSEATSAAGTMSLSSVDDRSHYSGRSGISSNLTSDTGDTGQRSMKRRKRRFRRVIKALSFSKSKKEHGAAGSTASSLQSGSAGGSAPVLSSTSDSMTNNNSLLSQEQPREVVIGGMGSKTASLPPIDETVVLPTGQVTVATLDREDEDDLLFFDALQCGDDGDDQDNLNTEAPDQPVILLDNVIAITPGGHINYEEGDSRPEPVKDSKKDKNKDKQDLLSLAPPPKASPLPDDFCQAARAPPPPVFLPLRFLRAGKGDVGEGKRRYKATLDWRAQNGIDNILREPSPHFTTIKKYYPHFCHGQGYHGEPCYYEQPAKTKLKTMFAEGASIEMCLRHYAMVTEFQWQYLIRDDLKRSIYIIDLQGMRFGDFVGDVVDFVKRAGALSSQHYPERAGAVYLINVPAWFKMIWNVIKPWVDEATLKKIHILRDKNEIRRAMEERIPLNNIPQEYGGQSPYPLGQSPEEKEFAALVEHNNRLARGDTSCGGGGPESTCKFCKWTPARSY